MGHVEHSRELVLQLVSGPIVADATACQAIVHQASRPHDLGSIAVIGWIIQHKRDGVPHTPQTGFCDVGGHVHVVILAEISLHGVHHHIRHASRSLVGRKGEGTLRIHDGKLGSGKGVAVPNLHVSVIIRYHACLTHLTARSWYGEYGSHGKHGGRSGFSKIEIPDLTRVRNSVSNGLRRVYH